MLLPNFQRISLLDALMEVCVLLAELAVFLLGNAYIGNAYIVGHEVSSVQA